MGRDATIYIKTKNGESPNLICDLAPDFEIVQEKNKIDSDYTTHEIICPLRYYHKGYERGFWPSLCWTFMVLFASKNVEKIWYGYDCDNMSPITIKEVLKISEHFMKKGFI